MLTDYDYQNSLNTIKDIFATNEENQGTQSYEDIAGHPQMAIAANHAALMILDKGPQAFLDLKNELLRDNKALKTGWLAALQVNTITAAEKNNIKAFGIMWMEAIKQIDLDENPLLKEQLKKEIENLQNSIKDRESKKSIGMPLDLLSLLLDFHGEVPIDFLENYILNYSQMIAYVSNTKYWSASLDSMIVPPYLNIAADKYYTVYYDPLTLDLNNDGKLNVVGTDGGVHFDFNNDGLAGNTGWVGKDDGLLIFDANEDNNVTNGSELFGEGFIIGQKVREDGTIENIYAKNGFEALASLDTNKDGIVDANDKDFDKIKVWQDKNGNGKVDAGEMLTLKELGIVGLNTGYQNKNETLIYPRRWLYELNG